MPGAKPAILIVHGGYQLPLIWSSFIYTAQNTGFQICCPRLPTCGDRHPPKASLADDINAVRTATTELALSGRSIIVLGHSYGGIVASEAVTPEFYGPLKNSKSGDSVGGCCGVVHMIYLSA
jgi:pimeloyl-ACP methyl ester carboxylesterase